MAAILALAALADLPGPSALATPTGDKNPPSGPDRTGLHRAETDPVTGGFRTVMAPKPGRYYRIGTVDAPVTIRIMVPAPNAWLLWSRLGSVASLQSALPGPALFELRPCAWNQSSLALVVKSMAQWIQGKPFIATTPVPRSNGSPVSYRRRVVRFRLPRSPLGEILTGNGDTRKRALYAEALVRVLESTMVLLSAGATCDRYDSPVIMVGSTVILVPRNLTRKQVRERILEAYEEERGKALSDLARGLPRHLLARRQLDRAVTNALAAPGRISRQAGQWARTLLTGPRLSRRPEGGILVFGSRRARTQVHLFTHIGLPETFGHLGILMLLAQAFPADLGIVLHPLDTKLGAGHPGPAQLLVASYLMGKLPKFLNMALKHAGNSLKPSLLPRAFGAHVVQAILAKAKSREVRDFLARELREVTSLGRLPTPATLVVDGRVVSYAADDEMCGLLTVFLSLQPGLLGRAVESGRLGARSLSASRR